MRKKVVGVAVVSALALLNSATPAFGQSSSSSDFQPGGVVGSSAITALSSYPQDIEHAFYENLFSSPIISQAAGNAMLSSISAVGSAEKTDLGGVEIRPTPPTVEGITEAALISKTPEEKAERWVVASPALKREIEVLVKPQKDASTSAPVLYLLDGVNADAIGDFLYQGNLSPIDDNVTIVMPTGARGSLWVDWEKEDPVLGRHMWETFLTKELPGVIENDASVNFNGKRAIGGISMGASGAVMIANRNLGMYQGILGISGCYSTMSTIGRHITYLNIHSRGGELDNLWGAFGSKGWRSHDVPSDPRGLSGTRMYLSAGSGVVDPDQRDKWLNQPAPMASNVLEAGVRTCTQELDTALTIHGVTGNSKIVYTDYGSHEWANFNQHFGPGWEYIRGALY
ncbi:Diacylglycerol acyltransferase/mycolyltransferase Ag85A precursor [Corynebacterium kalinowskii]|uniref:Diacylglycerol acyltransferase/mycolyltransferase Ag85A n=1 Tax=Corynebacterium kalinowskii TaxID=2675216 RepID=A0A6B8VW52_9CORY|nr:alpha/beta hydrolase family protein [Corynebacterium kalinowskii]QGU01540.1 Diacylglycerol acyltransferase/mycolyltransferase Ag85A precursor [Corynebacterium kalinowskii]